MASMDQVPPVYSAKKINGVPAHKLARAGKDVPVKPARITIHNFELTSLDGDLAELCYACFSGRLCALGRA
jgi:tRNA pseudouridine55 synthase